MSYRVLIRCDGARVPSSAAKRHWDKQLDINRFGSEHLNLRLENLSHALKGQISPRGQDLADLAAYVYAADQVVSRGGGADVHGDSWRRELHLCVPVSDPDFWSEDSVQASLCSVLRIATDDFWSFTFSPPRHEVEQLVLSGGAADLLNRPDSVLLFSGGADSLCAVVEEVAQLGGRPLLLSHRPSGTIDHRQSHLRDRLEEKLPDWQFPRIGIWAHRKGSDPNDNSQRSRSFLFSSLAAAFADALGLRRIILADNGIVSLNIPINQQVIGAKASRSTHPKFLAGMNRLVQTVLPESPQITNPLWSRTRAECMTILKEADVRDLLTSSYSCAHWTRLPVETPLCGVCSQCVDRRFASMFVGMEAFDPRERYRKDIFRDPLSEGPELTLATSYVGFARRVNTLVQDDDFLLDFKELTDCVLPDDPDADSTMSTMTSMLRRHSTGVLEVLACEISRASRELVAGHLPSTCLIALNPPTIVARPLVLKMQPPPLTPDQEQSFKEQDFKSRLPIRIDGKLSGKKSNSVLVDENRVELDDADFVLLLRLVLQLNRTEDGFLTPAALRRADGCGTEEELIPRGWQQALSRLRKYFRGRVGGLSHLEFIESRRGKVRLSTHARFVMVDSDELLRHENDKVRMLAACIRSAQEQAREFA